jgi:hypothetical protein
MFCHSHWLSHVTPLFCMEKVTTYYILGSWRQFLFLQLYWENNVQENNLIWFILAMSSFSIYLLIIVYVV